MAPSTDAAQHLLAAGGFGATPLPAVTALRLRIGQISDQLLLNPSFESTPPTASWTATVGSWQALTASPYGSPTYLRPNDGASAQLEQIVTQDVVFLHGELLNNFFATYDRGEFVRDASGYHVLVERAGLRVVRSTILPCGGKSGRMLFLFMELATH